MIHVRTHQSIYIGFRLFFFFFLIEHAARSIRVIKLVDELRISIGQFRVAFAANYPQDKIVNYSRRAVTHFSKRKKKAAVTRRSIFMTRNFKN